VADITLQLASLTKAEQATTDPEHESSQPGSGDI
jgi:hypothetical protein